MQTMEQTSPDPGNHFDASTLHKVEIKELDDRFVIIIDDDLVFVANPF